MLIQVRDIEATGTTSVETTAESGSNHRNTYCYVFLYIVPRCTMPAGEVSIVRGVLKASFEAHNSIVPAAPDFSGRAQ